jgi:hypothetical protein
MPTAPPPPPPPHQLHPSLSHLQQLVDLLHGSGLGQLKHAVGDAAVGQGHTDGQAV